MIPLPRARKKRTMISLHRLHRFVIGGQSGARREHSDGLSAGMAASTH